MDGTANKGGEITHYIDLDVAAGTQPHHWFYNPKHRQQFYIANHRQDNLILGYPWIAATKLTLDWSEPTNNPIIIVGPTNWLPDGALQGDDKVIMRIQQTTHAQKFAEAAHDKTETPWTER